MNANSLVSRPWSWTEQLLLRRAPQDDVFSRPAMAAALAAYLGVGWLQAVGSTAWRVALAMSFTDTLVMVLFTWTVLQLGGRLPRLVQTLTALAGTGVMLGILAIPLVWNAPTADQADSPGAAVVSGWLVLLVWSLAVQAHIFRHALSTRFGIGLIIAILHSVIAIKLLEILFTRVLEAGAG